MFSEKVSVRQIIRAFTGLLREHTSPCNFTSSSLTLTLIEHLLEFDITLQFYFCYLCFCHTNMSRFCSMFDANMNDIVSNSVKGSRPFLIFSQNSIQVHVYINVESYID